MLSSQAFGRGFGGWGRWKEPHATITVTMTRIYWWYQFAFFQTFCDFFNWVNLSEISVGEHSWGLILGTVSKIKNLMQRAALLDPFSIHQCDTTSWAVSPQQMLSLEKYPFLLFNWVYLGVSWPPSPRLQKKLKTKMYPWVVLQNY